MLDYRNIFKQPAKKYFFQLLQDGNKYIIKQADTLGKPFEQNPFFHCKTFHFFWSFVRLFPHMAYVPRWHPYQSRLH
jgi:hypothetical protein